MYLVVKQGDRTIGEFRFTEGPISIGRQANSQVLLRDGAVSKQHAVIFNTEDAKWMVEDLDSANKTYLNDDAVHKAEIKTGDNLRIADFTIEVNLDEKAVAAKSQDSGGPAHLEDTLTATLHGPQIIARKISAEQAPPIRFPAQRAVDFLQATEQIRKAGGLDEVLQTLLGIAAKQFDSYHTWCALRDSTDGPMTSHAGVQRNSQPVQLDDIKFNEKINEAVEKQQFLLFLFSKDPEQAKETQVRSVLIAPVVSSSGCFGVLYVNNTFRDDHYNLGDLDYMMLLTVYTANILETLQAQP